jgi:hypothetical protein
MLHFPRSGSATHKLRLNSLPCTSIFRPYFKPQGSAQDSYPLDEKRQFILSRYHIRQDEPVSNDETNYVDAR